MQCPNKNHFFVIYRIRNLVNNKCYIGSAKNLHNRVVKHLSDLRRNTHHSIVLQRAYNLYGELNFVVEVIEQVTQETLLQREAILLELLGGEYNTQKAKNGFFLYTHSAEIIVKYNTRFEKNSIEGLKKKEILPDFIIDVNKGIRKIDICDKYNISQVTFDRYRRIINKYFPDAIAEEYKIRKPEYPIDQLNEQIKQLLPTKSTREIANILGVGKSTISYRTVKYKLNYAMSLDN